MGLKEALDKARVLDTDELVVSKGFMKVFREWLDEISQVLQGEKA